jgi:hypothetical protein
VKTDIEYLKQLEIDLEVLAETDATPRRTAPAPRGRGGRADQGRWLRTVGAAAAMLTLAWAIGFVAQGNLSRTFSSVASDQATSAGTTGTSAPEDGAPTEARDRALLDEDAALDYGGDQDAVANWQAAPSAAPQPADVRSDRDDGGALSGSGLAKIVRDGSVALVIPNETFDTRFQRLFVIAADHGGFVLSSQTRGGTAGGVVMRIPAENFEEAIFDVRQLGTVSASQVNGTDVTGEYIDLSARLKILEARRAALLTILAEANGIGEILAVQNRVDDVQLEIEKIQGRLRYLDDQVDESTLRVDMREKRAEEEQRLEADEGVDLPSLGRALELAVQGTLNVLATMIVGIGYLLPLALVGLAVWGAVRLVRRRDREAS